MNIYTLGFAAVAALIIGIFGFTNAPLDTGPIKIGVSIPLTGEAASYGEWMKAGIDLAVSEINSTGGVDGRTLTIVYEDDGCAAQGVTAVTKLTSIDKVDALLGPLCSSVAGGALPIAEAAKTPTVFWASAPGFPALGAHLFRVFPPDDYQGVFAAEYAYQTLGARRVAILYVQNDWGLGLRSSFAKRFEELGGVVVSDDGVLQDAVDVRTNITKIRTAQPDLVYLPLYPASAVKVLSSMRTQGIQAPVLAGEGLEAEEVLREPAADGVLMTASVIANPEGFKAKVKTATGKDAGAWTPVAYDAVYVLADAIRRGGTEPESLRKALEVTDYTKAVSYPRIRFDNDGDFVGAQYQVKVIQNGKAVPYTK